MNTNLTIDVISGVATSHQDTEQEAANREAAHNLQIPINAREKRNGLLSESDWTQVIDAPIDQAAWATYRQSLRDIPSQSGFPNEITWPTEPEV
tara:strand:- start:57 stop:338 length:282 start_codon:yes stop_codon:yes gene_type:complete